MRSGTSWLRRHLNAHPQIWMAEPKELHFFDRHFVDDSSRYASHFADAPDTASAGEFTPAYAILESEMVGRIRGWMPELKILMILRDPVKRAWSHARKDFAKYWGKEIEDATLEDLRPFFDSPNIAKRGDYLSCLQTWLAHFPKEQFFVSFMEDVKTDPEGVLREHFEFLGVESDQFDFGKAELSKPINPRPSVPLPEGAVDYLRETLSRQNPGLEELLGRPMPWAT